MAKINCDICQFVKETDNPVIETKYWIVLLANEQAYLGRCYVTLKRHCGDLAKLKKEEWLELLSLIKKLEMALKDTFNPALFNWTCLMNLAYQNDPPNPHIHWHFMPRYNRKVKFKGITFDDPEFGHHYAREKERSKIVSEKVKNEIIVAIGKRLARNP